MTAKHVIAAGTVMVGVAGAAERQVTTQPQSHVLTNVNVWSSDGEWIVYDVRNGDKFDGARIEQVNVQTGHVQRLYTARDGAGCGVVTYSPADARVVFIHGPENPTAEWSYGFTRRRGVTVEIANPGVAHPLDAMTYAPPLVPGALRGGSHVHVFSADGKRVSFTYEDELLARLDATPDAPPHEPNQRNVGVAAREGAVAVPRTHLRNQDGEWFSVLVTRTVARPAAGSDEISKAFEEGWVGREGYLRPDGSRQRSALTFQGLVTAPGGTTHAEVFIVDLPDQLSRAGALPLEGTATTRPAPPSGTTQRRLTFTAERKFPGVAASPRHWLRASPGGSQIAFLMKDGAGVVQLWTVSPNGGEPRQVTRNLTDIASAFTWHPSGRMIAHVMDGSVCVTEVATGRTRRLTPRGLAAEAPLPLACVVSPDGRHVAYSRNVATASGTFPQIFVVETGGPSSPD